MDFGQGKIGGKYALGPKIGGGSFGEVYLVNNFGTQEIYALKKEDQKAKHLQLMAEAKILKNIESNGFAQVYWTGTEYKANMMVMELLGPSIEDLFVMCGKRFSLKTTVMLADQFLQRIEWLHSKDYIHRDIKPQNFLMGLGRKTHVAHLIDFGLSKKYRDAKTHQHIPYKQNKNLTGTARYASVNSHLGIQQSRRDDLESIGYVLVYLAQGYLPWQGVRANNKMEKYQKIMEKKMSIPVQVQCKHLPIQFSIYLNYCRGLRFEEKPNYTYLRNLFLDLMDRENSNYNYDFDWCHLNVQKQMQPSKIKIQIRKPIQQDIKDDEQPAKAAEPPKNNKDFDNNILVDQPDSSIRDSAIEQVINEGEQNIIEEDLIDVSEKDVLANKPLIELDEKKNKLLDREY